MLFKRKPEERKTEAKRAKDKYIDSSDLQDIGNRLGIHREGRNEAKIRFELNRLKGKSKATWKACKLTEEDFKRFGIKV